MKKLLNKSLAVLLVITMLLCIAPFTAAAESYSGTCGDNLTWSLDIESGVLKINGTGDMEDYPFETSVPWCSYRNSVKKVIFNNKVTSVGKYAFYRCVNLEEVVLSKSTTKIGSTAFEGCENLLSIEIPDKVTTIEDFTFRDCHALTEINIPDSVTHIGNWAFDDCVGFTDIVIPDSVVTIGKSAFINCTNLKTVRLSENLESIGDFAFEECESLKNLTIPASVSSIGKGLFYYCPSLMQITVSSSNKYYSSDNGVLFDKNKRTIINYPMAKSGTEYVIPYSVTNIGEYSFTFCEKLTDITIPTGVKTIGNFAFGACKGLVSIDLPESITEIGNYSFASCTALEHLVIPEGVTNIGNNAFEFCEMDYIHIPSSVKNIGVKALNGTAYYVCNTTESCYAKTYANDNSVDFKVCSGHEKTDTPITPDVPSADNIYNLGEETYGFENYVDTDSWGHCFGMSMTSSAYYINELDITKTGINNVQDINNLNLSSAVKDPICYYQAIQGSYSLAATVAGGSAYKTGIYDINSDWNEVINYVKSHDYDNKGSLQIGFRKDGEGGHAINFLRYEVVDGEQRIYAYDNNFPETETYFYKDSYGKIRQAPYSTFSNAIDCIALRDVATYFNEVSDFDLTRYMYADKDSISVSGAKVYPIDVTGTSGEKVVFEIPANVDKVVITPLVNNAEFTYLNEEYSFGKISDDTIGMFKLANTDDGSTTNPEMIITSKSETIEISIKTPSVSTINYGETLVLTLEETEIPEGYAVEWFVEGAGVSTWVSEDGKECRVTSIANGSPKISAKLVDENGEPATDNGEEIADEITITSKAGFFQKFISFFKNLFGINRIVY